MKNITKFIVFAALMATAGNLRAAVIHFSISLPVESLSTHDLDARDAFNRPVQVQSAKSNFLELWNRTLSQKLIQSLTPLRIKMLALLNSAWDGFAGLVQTAKQFVIHSIKAWLTEKKKVLVLLSLESHVEPHLSQTSGALFNSFGHTSANNLLIVASTQILR